MSDPIDEQGGLPPTKIRYVPIPTSQDNWEHFQAVHATSKLPISTLTWATLLSQYPRLGEEFTIFLRGLSLEAFLWECRASDGWSPFEFAVGPALPLKEIQHADPGPFGEYLYSNNIVKEEDDGSSCGDTLGDVWDGDSDGRVGADGGSVCSWTSSSDDDSESEDECSTGFRSSLFQRPSEIDSDDSSCDSNPEETVQEEQGVACIFKNLGGDATLIAPRPSSPETADDLMYAHLGSYIQRAPLEQTGKLWSIVATVYRKLLLAKLVKRNENCGETVEERVYLSTNGLGVSYLHFRLERRSKYYNFMPFCSSNVPCVNNKHDSHEAPLRIQIASDLHTEFYGLTTSKKIPEDTIIPRAPILALVGDIGNACTGALRAFLHDQADRFEKVLYIVGNHEFYNVGRATISITEQWEWLRQVCNERDNLHLLEQGSMDIQGVRVLGTTLWSAIPDGMLEDAEMGLNDYELSYNHQKGQDPRKLKATETRDWHEASLRWLRKELDRAQHEGVPTVVLTHHTPQLQGTSHPRYADDPLQCCFSTDLTSDLLSVGLQAWACGHTHFNFDRFVVPHQQSYDSPRTPTRLMSNQRGYAGGLKKDYNPSGGVLEVYPVL